MKKHIKAIDARGKKLGGETPLLCTPLVGRTPQRVLAEAESVVRQKPDVIEWRVEPHGWTDQLTGTDGPRLWDRIISSETARVKRYHGPATIVLAELFGVDSFSAVWGADAAGRLFVQLARTLAVEVRSSDHIARLETSRFGILLIETDKTETEVGAPGSGRLHQIGEPGDVFPCGQLIGLLLAEGETPPEPAPTAAPTPVAKVSPRVVTHGRAAVRDGSPSR